MGLFRRAGAHRRGMGYETRSSCRARQARALAVALALAVASAAVAPVAPGPANVARAQGGTGIIAHSSKGYSSARNPTMGRRS